MDTNINPAVYLNTFKLQELRDLIDNQTSLEKEPPITTRATFKLSHLEALIDQIKKDPRHDPQNEDYHHMICITFVRDDVKNPVLDYHHCINFGDVDQRATNKDNKRLTQMVPIITGCDAHLDSMTGCYETFEYFYVNGEIPYVRSGGEGSGLIPPPPPKASDEGQ